MSTRLPDWLVRLLGVQRDEAGPVAAGFLLFALLFTGYFMLRPVREAMGVAGGVDNLPWLFTATFIATLAAQPLFGWIASRAARRRILTWTYIFFATNLLLFAAGLAWHPQDVWIGRVFYVWLSVFNLLALSVGWSVLADVFSVAQARRVFALAAAGLSLGGLLGPLLGVALVGMLGLGGLLLLAAAFLVAAIMVSVKLQAWRERHPLPADERQPRSRPLGGSVLAGAREVLRSPYLLGIAVFVLLLTTVTTFLYFEQARLVEQTFTDRAAQYRVFALLDTVVQCLAIAAQLFITGHVARRLGIGVLLTTVPLVVAAGFIVFALVPTFAAFAVVMVVRRAGEYGFVRPAREMLFTVLTPEAKYKAKNFVDTVVYRGGDAVSGWAKTGIDALAQQPSLVALIGAGIALVWAGSGLGLARAYRRAQSDEQSVALERGP